MDIIDLNQFLFPLTQVEIDKANYKGGVKRSPQQKPRYNVHAGVSIEGARHLFKIATEKDVKNLKVLVGTKTINATGLNTVRFHNLATRTNCVTCERSLAYFRLESNGGEPHLNGYSHDHVMMTRDHIVPRSAGGPDVVENIQMMCSYCNKAKASLPMEEFVKRKLSNRGSFVSNNDLVMKRGATTISQEVTVEFTTHPGVILKAVIVGETPHDLRRNPKVCKLDIEKDGKSLGYLPEPYEKDKVYDYTYTFYCHGYGGIKDLKALRKFSDFDRLVFPGDHRLLDGSIVKLTEF